MNPELAGAIAQLGTAGLIGWMWLAERRAASSRERQLTEAHDRLLRERETFSLVITALQDNTRVLTSLDLGQRSLTTVLDRLITHQPTFHSPT